MSAAAAHSLSGWNGAAPFQPKPGFPAKPIAADCGQEISAMQSSLMPRQMLPRSPGPMSRLQRHELQFRILLVATYPFFLVAAILQRLAPARSPIGGGLVTTRRSVFGEAKAMAVSAIPFVFMG